MSVHRWVVLSAAAALAAPAGAAAASKPQIHSRAFRVTAVSGSERVDFAGDAGAGCADHGVCGISGTETFTPDPPGADAVAFIISSGRTALGAIDLSGATTATVTTAGADAPCTDTLEVEQASAALAKGPSGWSAELHGTGRSFGGLTGTDADVFATHCAGPRTDDLVGAKALPRTTFHARDLDRKVLRLDLVSNRPFSGAGFAGHVTAEVRITLRRLSSAGAGLGTSSPEIVP